MNRTTKVVPPESFIFRSCFIIIGIIKTASVVIFPPGKVVNNEGLRRLASKLPFYGSDEVDDFIGVFSPCRAFLHRQVLCPPGPLCFVWVLGYY